MRGQPREARDAAARLLLIGAGKRETPISMISSPAVLPTAVLLN